MPNGGGSLPILNILLLVVALLTWWLGWMVLVVAVGLGILVTLGVAIYDRVTHSTRCRWCNRIKDHLEGERGIARERLRTKHVKHFDTHLLVHVYVDGALSDLVDIDYNERILDIQPTIPTAG